MNKPINKLPHFLKTLGINFAINKYLSFKNKKVPIGYLSSNLNLATCFQQWRCKSSPSTSTVAPKVKATRFAEVGESSSSKEQVAVSESEGWVHIGAYSVFAWSVSGIESCIVIKSKQVQAVFDLGIAAPQSVAVSNVFISHGHIDHVGAVVNHIAKRANTGMRPARYFLPPHLVQPMLVNIQAHAEMAEAPEVAAGVNILPFNEGDTVRLNDSYSVKTFPTIHRVPSQGYILYKEERKLKVEYQEMESMELVELEKNGVDVHDIVVTPELAYTGDTVFDVFTKPPNPDLLKVKVLITEATFLDEEFGGKNMIQKSKERGHSHLMEFATNPEIFKDVGHILLIHFSNKYSSKYINDAIRDRLPSELLHKITPATVAKSTVASTYSEYD